MNSDRWRRVEEIFHQAAELAPPARPAFLDEACAGDESLRKEVESLLAHDSEDGATFAGPAGAPQAPGGLAAGQRVSHYQIQEKLAEGGMGAVYRAYDTQLHRPVALKVLPPEYASDPERRSRLLREARAASALHHPNIVGIHEVGSDSGVDFIAMELIEGKTLGDIIPARGLPLGKTLDYAVQIAGGLAKAHAAGVVHRDLKPGNIMLTRDGLVKLLDFGLAQRVELGERHDATLTVEGEIVGTPAYMSPEQAQGKTLDARSDLYSLGVILYHMLAGRPPYTDDDAIVVMARHIKTPPRPISEVAPEARVPPEVEALVMRVLSKEPEKRPDSAEAMIAELTRVKESAVVTSGVRASLVNGTESLLEGAPNSLPPAAPTMPSALGVNDTLGVPLTLPQRSPRWLVPALGAALLVAILAVIFFATAAWRSSPAPVVAATPLPAPPPPTATVTATATATAGAAPTATAATSSILVIPTVAATALPHPEPTSPRGGHPRPGSKPAGTSSVGYGYLE